MACPRHELLLPQIKALSKQKSGPQRPVRQNIVAETFSSLKKQKQPQLGFSFGLELISSKSAGPAQASIAPPVVRSKVAEQAGVHKQLCRRATQVSKQRTLPPASLRLKAGEQTSDVLCSIQASTLVCSKKPLIMLTLLSKATMSYKVPSAGSPPLERFCLCQKHEDPQDMPLATIKQAAELQQSDREFCCSEPHLFATLSSSARSTPVWDLTEDEQSGEVSRGSGVIHDTVPASPQLPPSQNVVDEAVDWAVKLADRKASQAKLVQEYSIRQSFKVRQEHACNVCKSIVAVATF